MAEIVLQRACRVNRSAHHLWAPVALPALKVILLSFPLVLAACLAGGRALAQEPASSQRIHLPEFPAAGLIEAGEGPVRLGVIVTPVDMECGTGADAWPCGQVARAALQRFVRRRVVECWLPPEAPEPSAVTRCTVGGADIAEWLVSQGWARAEGRRYREAETAAREAKLGIWSPVRPGPAPRLASPGEIDRAGGAALVRAVVTLSAQRMTLIHRGTIVGHWPVSTARRGKITPTGSWRAQWLSRHHRSSLYDNAPMPYSVFFNGNYAIHGTYQIGQLGQPASAGCIRLHPDHAAILFELARQEGLENTLIIVRQ